ncbi:unnamed protein product [Linum trigynum]|uniref:Uncharacterized protein n=1 Tax=Linum trigynum TaxID=586398 RepID=A0AAV2GVB1_9ROSI
MKEELSPQEDRSIAADTRKHHQPQSATTSPKLEQSQDYQRISLRKGKVKVREVISGPTDWNADLIKESGGTIFSPSPDVLGSHWDDHGLVDSQTTLSKG